MLKKSGLLLICICLIVSSFGVSGQDSNVGSITEASFESGTLGREYEYLVYLPAGYEDSEAEYPVIYMLHGRGDEMSAWLNVQDLLDSMIASSEIPPMIAVMPDFPSSRRAGYYIDSQFTNPDVPSERVETAFFEDLIPHIEATYRTIEDRSGRIIAGYSMGGYGAIRYALAHPDVFCTAIVLSPAVYTPLPPADSSTRTFGAFGVGDDVWFDDDVYLSLNYPALTDAFLAQELPLYMFIAVGDDEWKNPTEEDQYHDLDFESHLLFNRVRRVGFIVSELRVLDGDHNWEFWRRGFTEGMQFAARFVGDGT